MVAIGSLDRELAVWLRFYDEAGNVVPLPEEAAEQQGLEQGLQQGLQKGARSQLLRLLTLRFGTVPEDRPLALIRFSPPQPPLQERIIH